MNDFLDNDFLKIFLKNTINSDDNINMIFYGLPGSGKTTITRQYLNYVYESNKNYLEINSSDNRGINYYKNILLDFINNKNIKKKTIFLDEVDNLTIDSQIYLNNLIEYIDENNIKANFIIVCNYITNINFNLINKFYTFRFKKISNKILKIEFDKKCKQYNVNIKNKNKIIKSFNNDFRKLNQYFLIEKNINHIIDNNDIYNKLLNILINDNITENEKYNYIDQLLENINLKDIINDFFKYCLDKSKIDKGILIDIFIKLQNNINIDYNKKLKTYELIFSFNNI